MTIQKTKKTVRVTIRFSQEDFDLLSKLAKSTYSSGSLSRLIRHYLNPVIKELKNNSS